MKILLNNLRQWLSRLSFRTGVIVLLCCIPCYILSFAQMALPNQYNAQERALVHTVRHGKDIAVWRSYHTWRGRS